VTDEPNTASPPDLSSVQTSLPPLRIHHFLVWMAVTAAMFAVLAQTELFDSSQTFWAVTIVIVGHVLCSAGLTCLAFGAVWWWRGLRFPSEPGHAFVIFTGLATLLNELLIFLFSEFLNGGDEAAHAYYGMSGGVSQLVMRLMRWTGFVTAVLLAGLSIMFALWLARCWRWRLVFALLAAMMVVGATVQKSFSLLMQMTSRGNVAGLVLWTNLSIDAIPTAVLLLCLALAVQGDRRMAVSRHWSHWVGVAIYAFDGSFKLAKYAVWYLLLSGP